MKSRRFWCTARTAAQSAMPTRCTGLHGPANHCGCTALHGLEKVYCIAARSCTVQQIHQSPTQLTATRPSILLQNLSYRNPNHKSGSARPAVHELHGTARTGGPAVLHGAARNVRCQPLHGIARNPCSRIASFTWVHVTARQFPENTT